MMNINSFLGSWVSSFYIYPFLLAAIISIKSYFNAEADKGKIIKENKDKSGIYMFQNTINGKLYIGSSDNLNRRFTAAPAYFNINHLRFFFSLVKKNQPATIPECIFVGPCLNMDIKTFRATAN